MLARSAEAETILREVIRLSDDDKRLLAAIAAFQHEAHRPSRYLAVDPHEYLQAHRTSPPGREKLPVAQPPKPGFPLNSS